jgi:hypothetical protein
VITLENASSIMSLRIYIVFTVLTVKSFNQLTLDIFLSSKHYRL